MKFKVQMKDPDTLYDAMRDAIGEDVREIPGLSDQEREAVQEKRQEAVSELCAKWFEYGEYLTVEIDTEAQTCVVVPYR
jgi:hypothetical protein